MYSLRKEFKFEYAHRLMLHKGACSNIHGHSAKVRVEIYSEYALDNDMIIDFSELKCIQEYLDDQFDHKLILNENDPLYPIMAKIDYIETVRIDGEPTAENFARIIAFAIKSMVPTSVFKVTFWETKNNSATYKFN